MKNKLNFKAIAAVFAAFLIGASASVAQQIAGGYGDVSANDRFVQEAAKFAVAERKKQTGDKSLKFVSVENARQQVVAGMNYEVCMTVNSYAIDVMATAVIYQDLSGKYSLSEWKDGRCGKEDTESADDDLVTYKGTLNVGTTESSILYLGAESGDYAAFCFANDSAVGKAVLEKCAKGGQCEFVGKVDGEAPCKVPGLEADLSASGRITSIKSVRPIARKKDGMEPGAVVKKLYASQKSGKSPFFQTDDRALVDEFFEDDLADLIWTDAVEANGGVGVLSFDPLYNTQDDSNIRNFVIGKARIDKISNVATVVVTFKNFRKSEKVTFFFEPDSEGNWKIMDITYKDGTSLKSMYFDAKLAAENKN